MRFIHLCDGDAMQCLIKSVALPLLCCGSVTAGLFPLLLSNIFAESSSSCLNKLSNLFRKALYYSLLFSGLIIEDCKTEMA